MRWHACLGFALLAPAACKGAERPRTVSAASQTLAVSRPGFAIRGVAGDGAQLYAAFAARGTAPSSQIESRRGEAVLWKTPLGGTAGELALTDAALAVAIGGTGSLTIGTPIALRGDPGAVLVALERQTGKQRWRLAFDSTEWTLITSLAATGGDLLVAGSFGGTLRVGAQVVSTAGGSDGFVARVNSNGQLVWLVRLGGAGADAVQGVAATTSRIAIAGTFTAGADLLGHPLPPIDEKAPFGDAFVAELDANGARRWSATFGGRADDAVAGVAIDAGGHVAVAASVRDVVRVGSQMLPTQGPGDGLVVWYAADGEQTATALIGGSDFDGLRSIAALGNHVVVGGFFSGSIKLAERTLTAGGGDDSFLAALDASGTMATAWHVGGEGREEIAALSPVPGGFVASVAHTAAATIEGATVPAPSDPASGAALVVRGL